MSPKPHHLVPNAGEAQVSYKGSRTLWNELEFSCADGLGWRFTWKYPRDHGPHAQNIEWLGPLHFIRDRIIETSVDCGENGLNGLTGRDDCEHCPEIDFSNRALVHCKLSQNTLTILNSPGE